MNVAIVTYNSAAHVPALLRSLPEAAAGIDLNVVVVDNGSMDETLAAVRAVPGVRLVPTGRNLGYSGGINVARDVLGEGDLAILNPDLRMAPGSLKIMQQSLTPGVGIVVPRLMDGQGHADRHLRRESSVSGMLGDALFGSRWTSRPRVLTDDLLRSSDYEVPRDVAWGGAAAWLVSAECNAQVGAWDSDQYFLYSEETDYAFRARQAGYRIRYQPAAVGIHDGGGSGTSGVLLSLMSVNRVRYFRQHNSRVRAEAYRAAVLVRHALRAPFSAQHRLALRTVARTNSWNDLPGAEHTPSNLQVEDTSS